MNALPESELRRSRETLHFWWPAALSAAGAVGLALYLAFRSDQVDIDVYRMGGQNILKPDLYAVTFGNSHLLFTYPPFAALAFALLPLNSGSWPLQAVWGLVNIATLVGLIYMSIRIVVPRLEHKQILRWALLGSLPAMALNPVFTNVGLGQINLILCVLVMWDLATPRKIGSRTLPLGIATGIAAAVKLTPLIFIPYLLITRRARGAFTGIVTFVACETLAAFVAPGDSWTYWTRDVFNSKRAGALLYASDQNLSSVLQRFHHGPVPNSLLVPLSAAICIAGLALAAWAYRRSSSLLGLLVCATTGLIISPITWVHHLVWIVPVIIWLILGSDRPRTGRLIAGFVTVLFVSAPIWWVPTSWMASNNPPAFHENHWQLVAGNSFFFALVAFLVGVTILLSTRWVASRRSAVARGRIGSPRPAHDEGLSEELDALPQGSEARGEVDRDGALELVGSDGQHGAVDDKSHRID